jgi:hypothetical protein
VSVVDISKALIFRGGTLPTGGVSPGDLVAERDARIAADAAAAEAHIVANTYYVKQNGSNSAAGTSWGTAFRSIERALEIATLSGAPAHINWAAEAAVTTQGRLDMPDNCTVTAAHRTVFIRPASGYAQRNVFRMGSGCFIEGMMFEGWRVDDFEDPTEGFAVSFRPGAVIQRVPYAHKIAVRSLRTWGPVAPPLKREAGNPDIPRGGGVALADGLVCSAYSPFPNIMTWGATPVSENAIGYCARNGGLINAVNAVSMWGHQHFLAMDGGQLILSGCTTQFGDYSLVAKGGRQLVVPVRAAGTLTAQATAASAIEGASAAIIDAMWAALVLGGYTSGTPANFEALTRADAATFLQAVAWTLRRANETPMIDFAIGMFDAAGESVFSPGLLDSFVFSFQNMRDQMIALPDVNSASDTIITNLVAALVSTISAPVRRFEPSLISAIGHTWTAVMCGVALSTAPPAINRARIEDSILQIDGGIVRATGQDDQGNALFVGGMTLDAATGELGGPPFVKAVDRIATQAANIGSF